MSHSNAELIGIQSDRSRAVFWAKYFCQSEYFREKQSISSWSTCKNLKALQTYHRIKWLRTFSFLFVKHKMFDNKKIISGLLLWFRIRTKNLQRFRNTWWHFPLNEFSVSYKLYPKLLSYSRIKSIIFFFFPKGWLKNLKILTNTMRRSLEASSTVSLVIMI